jgi:protein MpaA
VISKSCASTATRRVVAALAVAAAGVAGCARGDVDGAGTRHAVAKTRVFGRTASTRAVGSEAAEQALTHRRVVIGASVQGRPIFAVERGSPTAPFSLVVVGCIHGDEPAGIAIARAVESQLPTSSVNLWVIDDLNPDGVSAGTRQNADGVDLNRNFPYDWQPIGRPGDEQYSGAGPLSEPEARAAASFLDRVRPSVTIWFHQHGDVVDLSGGSTIIETRFARMIGLPVARLTRYPGSVASWENHRYAHSTAFVVELPAGPARPALVRRALAAIDSLHK